MKRLLFPLLLAATVPAWAQHEGHDMADSDTTVFHQVLVDQLEATHSKDGSGMAWDAQAWIGRDYGREVEVLSGIQQSDLIVLNPSDSLESGQPVNVKQQQQSPQGASAQ